MKEKISALWKRIKNALAPYQKNIIHPLLAILGITLICTLITKYLGGDETLAEYARNNPEVAYAHDNSDNSISKNDLSNDDITTSPVTVDGSVSGNIGDVSANLYTDVSGNQWLSVYDGFEYAVYDETSSLSQIHVLYWNFDNETVVGQLICHNTIAPKLLDIFYSLYLSRYQIEKIVPMSDYNNDYDTAIADNNTFCYFDDTNLLSSYVSWSGATYHDGLTVEINPFYNPKIFMDSLSGQMVSIPENMSPYTDRTLTFPYKIDTDDLCYKYFTEAGFAWGGNYNANKIYSQFTYTLR